MSFIIDKQTQCKELISKLPKPFSILISEREGIRIKGFLIEKCPLIKRMEKNFERYILEEVLYSAKRFKRETKEPEGLLKSKALYLNVFKEGVENSSIFDSGRNFLKIFLLSHLIQYKTFLPEVPAILKSVVPEFPSQRAEEVKLKIFFGLLSEIGKIIENKSSYEILEEIKKAPHFFLEKEMGFPKSFPWAFGEVFYDLDSSSIKRYLSEAMIYAKEFLNSKEGKKICLSFFKREISLEEALGSEEILEILPISRETYEFMKKFSLNLRYGEIFQEYLGYINFCEKIDDSYFFRDVKIDKETKPIIFSLAGVISPVIYRNFLIFQMRDYWEIFKKISIMDFKTYGELLKEKENLEVFIKEKVNEYNLMFENYIKDGFLISSRNEKNLFDFCLYLFFNLIKQEFNVLPLKKIKGYLEKGSFYILPFFQSKEEVKYEIFGEDLDEGYRTLSKILLEKPVIIVTHNFLSELFENIEIKEIKIFKTKIGVCLKIIYKDYIFLIYPYEEKKAMITAEEEGETLKKLEPKVVLLKINEILENLKKENFFA